MSSATDYLPSASARFLLRLDGTDLDAEVSQTVSEAVSLVSRMTGRDLLAVETEDIDEGLKTVVGAVTRHLWDGQPIVPATLLLLIQSYRIVVDTAEA